MAADEESVAHLSDVFENPELAQRLKLVIIFANEQNPDRFSAEVLSEH